MWFRFNAHRSSCVAPIAFGGCRSTRRIFAAGVEHVDHLDRVCADAVDQNVIGMHHHLAGADDATGAIYERKLGQPFDADFEARLQRVSCSLIPL